ncbi:MAG: type II toxin-antitoxin system RelE/ParE family toxin [Firmicutes bacterium]|nr:type II toxin-antitoxin system RelE/ParE family toxin [Bacillota bacterium]
MLKVIYSDSAKLEVENILRYIKRFSIERAKGFVKGLKVRVEELPKSPYIGKSVEEEYGVPNTRLVYYKTYKIFYTVVEEVKTIQIERVIHETQNFPVK